MSTRKYGMIGPVISNDRYKQTPLRGAAPQNPTAHGVSKSILRVIHFYTTLEFIPTP